MKVKFLNQHGITKELRKLMKDFDGFYWAVAWGTGNQLSDELIKYKDKIKRLIFGTHFYQTDPTLLEKFMSEECARIMPNDAVGIFHPKVYLFISAAKSAAIVGSANFTNSAMTRNSEAAILLEGESSDGVFINIKEMVDKAWHDGNIIDQEFLDNYKLHYNATLFYRRELGKQRSNTKPKKDARNKDLRIWSWNEFLDRIKRTPPRQYEERLSLLQEARKMFLKVKTFSELDDVKRRAIAGFPDGGYLKSSGINWKYFGSMVGQGDFKNLILNKNKYISDALDEIPLSGEIRKDWFDKYIISFERAFEGKSHKGGVPTASRLLAMRRPDTFLCIDSANRVGLGKDLGFAPTTLNFKKYWDNVIMPITESPWWQTPRPNGEEGLLWDGRVSMLDSIYYLKND